LGVTISIGMLSRYEKGIHPIPDYIIPTLAKVVELEPSQLRLEDVE